MGFFSSLLGKDSANAAQQLGYRNRDQINSSYADANGQAKTGYDDSMGYYKPYAEAGHRGQTAYENTLGLNGQQARQQQFREGYEQDPALQYRQQQNQTAMTNLLRKYNASGQGVNSGAALYGAGRLQNEQFNTDWGNYQNRLQGMGQQGFQAAGQQAGLTSGYYNGLADRAVGRGSALTQSDTNATMAASNARMQGMNNLMSGIGAVGGSVFKAFAPGAGGVSAAGNMASAFRGGM